MSLSERIQVTKKDPSRNEDDATPNKRRYNEELMFYVYQQVVEAAIRWVKDGGYRFDLDSVVVLLHAYSKADGSLKMDLLLCNKRRSK